MKKVFLALFMAVLLVVSLAGTAMAASPTTTTVTWVGGGTINGGVTSGNDNVITFGVNAATANGSFTATDNNDNPYSYNVDTVSGQIQSNFTNGSTFFQTNRTDSYSPMYGTSGQAVYNFVGSSGTGAMATSSWTNYAEMTNATYGQPKTANGYNFEASGSSYTIEQLIAANASVSAGWGGLSSISTSNSWSSFTAIGNGSAKIDSMTTGAYGANSVNLGWGGGCYTNADALFTGSGSFAVSATGMNGVTTPISGASGSMVAGGWTGAGNGSYNSVNLQTVMNFANGGSVGNFSVKVQ